MVVDDKLILIGTLTDGDVRRYILKGGDIAGIIQSVYNSNPISVFKDDFDLEKVKRIFIKNKIELIPILERNGKIVDYTTWAKAFGNQKNHGKEKLDVPVVIMAGGSGTAGSLKRIKEKPEYNFLVNAGMYVLSPAVLELIPDNQLFHITHLIDRVRENAGTIGVYPVSEKAWIDVGQWAEYRKTIKGNTKIFLINMKLVRAFFL